MADRKVVAHLLRRATFGPTAEEVDAAERAGLDATLAALLAPTGTDPGAATTPPPRLGSDPYAEITKNSNREDRQKANKQRTDQIQQLQQWWLDRMVSARPQPTE